MTQQPELLADAFTQYGPFVIWGNGTVDRTAINFCGKVKKITPKHIWIDHKDNGLLKLKKLDYQGGWQLPNKAKLFLWFERDPLTAFISNGL